MRDSRTDEFGISIGGRKVSNLRYADDTALCAETHDEICTLLNNINEEGKKKKKHEVECKEDQGYAYRKRYVEKKM